MEGAKRRGVLPVSLSVSLRLSVRPPLPSRLLLLLQMRNPPLPQQQPQLLLVVPVLLASDVDIKQAERCHRAQRCQCYL